MVFSCGKSVPFNLKIVMNFKENKERDIGWFQGRTGKKKLCNYIIKYKKYNK